MFNRPYNMVTDINRERRDQVTDYIANANSVSYTHLTLPTILLV